MPNLNKGMFMGHLCHEHEVKELENDNKVLNNSIAVNRKYKEKEETAFIPFAAWGRQAELIAEYTKKGDPIFIEGYFKQDKWENAAGEKRSRLVLNVRNFVFLGGKKEEGGDFE